MSGGKIVAPYGIWPSPVTTAVVAGQTIGLSALQADGGTLYWLESRPAERGRTVLVRWDGSALVDVTSAPLDVASRVHEYGGGAYAARNGRVVFSHKPDGSVWLVDGAEPRAITAVPGCRYADFRPDAAGRYAVCVREDHRNRSPTDPQAAIVALDLHPADPAANEGSVLVAGPDFLSSPRLSPDGLLLAWIAWNHPDMPWDATRLYVAPFNGTVPGEPRLLAGADRESLVQPAWSPDGVLHVCSDRTGWWNVYRVESGGLEPVCPMEAEIGLPHWVFGQRSYGFTSDDAVVAAPISEGVVEPVLLRGGTVEKLPFGPVQEAPVPVADGYAVIATPPDSPPSVQVVRPGATPSILREAGQRVLAPADVSVARPFAFSAGGGHTGHAFHYPPTSATHVGPPGDLPPLVVMSHGGPTSMSGAGFSPRVQWWTSRGFAVLDVNYGGSTGFGRLYRQRLNGQWGVVDVADCAAAASHLADTGGADPARMAIRGGSAGGYTTLAALAGTDVFRAGASHYGVADLLLLAADTHKFESRYLDSLIGPLPEAEAVYRDRSPLNHADRMSCPVIFFQGLDDRVVPPNQARVMAAALRARGLEAPLHEFAGEAHGFRRADTIEQVLRLETEFYVRVLGLG